jgi:hypothetical protein
MSAFLFEIIVPTKRRIDGARASRRRCDEMSYGKAGSVAFYYINELSKTSAVDR